MNIKAVIVLPGCDSGFHHYFDVLDPCLLYVGSKRVIEYTIEDIARANLKNVEIHTHERRLIEKLKLLLGNGTRWGLKIRYIHSQLDLPVELHVRSRNGERQQAFFLRGDMFRRINLNKIVNIWNKMKVDRLEAFNNRQRMYVAFITRETYLDKWISGQHKYATAILDNCFSCKLDDLQSYWHANIEYARGNAHIDEYMVDNIAGNINKHRRAKCDQTSYHGDNIYIGKNTHIHPNARLYDNCVVMENSRIGAGTYLENSMIMHQTQIGNNLCIKNSIVYKNKIINLASGESLSILDKNICGPI